MTYSLTIKRSIWPQFLSQLLIGWISLRAFISRKATRIDSCGTNTVVANDTRSDAYMIYLGIDVAKNSHVAAAMSSEGEVLLTGAQN